MKNLTDAKSILSLGLGALVLSLGACSEVKEAKETVKLQGDYQTKAMTGDIGFDDLDGLKCVKQSIEAAGLEMDFIQTFYDNADCKGDAVGRITTEGSFNIGGQLNDVTEGARAIDYTIDKVTVTRLGDGWGDVIFVDVTGECDVSDLPVNKPEEVTGKDCGDLGDMPKKDTIYFATFDKNDTYLHFTDLPYKADDKYLGTKDDKGERNTKLTTKYYNE